MLRAARQHEIMAELENMKTLGKPKPAKQAKKQNNPPIDKYAILIHRSRLCDCGCKQVGQDLHHCFIGRMKGYPILDDERNLVLVEHNEHIARKFDNLLFRVFFWEKQCQRFGKKAMLEWVDAVLAAGLDRSRIDWL
jgi:hypothetical protein